MQIKSIKQAKIKAGMKVLLRADYNVAIDKKGRVEKSELFRIEKSIPTIKFLIKNRAKVIIIAHLGRPGGKVDKKLSNKPLAIALGKILGKPVKMLDGVIEDDIKKQINEIKPGQVVLLENLRFYPGEDANDKKFSKQLAELGDIYVDDAFGNIHRKAASMVGITEFLPSYAGLLVEEEIENITNYILKAKKPLVFIMGGAKVGTKLPFIMKLLPQASKILVGGILANTILKSGENDIGSSVYDEKLVKNTKVLLDNKKIKLPSDVICDDVNTPKLEASLKNLDEIEKNERIIDIGIMSAVEFASEIRKAETVFFNGPLGFMEKPEGLHGSQAIAEIVAALSESEKIKSIVGGGETISLFYKLGLQDQVTYISTGGGSLFAFLLDPKQPGIKPLLK